MYISRKYPDTRQYRCDVEVKKRIAITKKKRFNNMKNILANVHARININIRIRTLKVYIHSTVTYGSETWTISTENKRSIEAAEMWCLRRMLRIPWTPNES